VAATGDETLLDERARRTQAAAASITAGILTIGGGVLAATVYSDLPTVPVLDALRERFAANPPQPGLKARQVLWYDDNALRLILVSVVLALAAAAIGLALSHLYRSVSARRPELPRYVIYTAIGGAVLVAVSGIHYDQARERGVVFHMMSAITELGRVGITAVGATADEADERYAAAEDTLLKDAGIALEPHTIW